jgi:phage shock protein A
MGIFSRLGTLIKSNLNDLISRAEDPEKMLNQVLLEMQQQLVEAKKAVAVAIADEKRLQKQYNAELDKAKEWERKAMLAVRAGDDNLARQALVRKQEHENISSQFQQQWIAQKSAVDKLKDALRLLANKIEEAKRKKNILIARKKRAEAQRQIASTMQGLGDTSAFDTFDRMAERITLLEAERSRKRGGCTGRAQGQDGSPRVRDHHPHAAADGEVVGRPQRRGFEGTRGSGPLGHRHRGREQGRGCGPGGCGTQGRREGGGQVGSEARDKAGSEERGEDRGKDRREEAGQGRWARGRGRQRSRVGARRRGGTSSGPGRAGYSVKWE